MKIKKLKLLLFLSIFLLAAAVPFFSGCAGRTGVTRLQFLRTEDGTAYHVRVRFGTYANGVVELPSEHRGRPVTGIIAPGFRGGTHFIAVTIPASVTYIASNAFRNTPALTVIMQGLEPPEQHDDSFNNAANTSTGVKAIIVPDAALQAYRTAWSTRASHIHPASNVINDYFLVDDGVLISYFGWQEEVIVPTQVTSISGRAFRNNQGIRRITIPQSVSSIDPDGFRGTSELSYIAVAAGNESFSSRNGILYNAAGTRIEYIPSRLGGAVVIPDGFVSMRVTGQNVNYNFSDAARANYFAGTLITSITIPGSFDIIPADFLRDTAQLTSVTLNEGITRIAPRSFANAARLNAITIPSTVTFISADAFAGARNLTITVPFTEDGTPSGWVEGWNAGRPVVFAP